MIILCIGIKSFETCELWVMSCDKRVSLTSFISNRKGSMLRHARECLEETHTPQMLFRCHLSFQCLFGRFNEKKVSWMDECRPLPSSSMITNELLEQLCTMNAVSFISRTKEEALLINSSSVPVASCESFERLGSTLSCTHSAKDAISESEGCIFSRNEAASRFSQCWTKSLSHHTTMSKDGE